jgi:hypothetical protein
MAPPPQKEPTVNKVNHRFSTGVDKFRELLGELQGLLLSNTFKESKFAEV